MCAAVVDALKLTLNALALVPLNDPTSTPLTVTIEPLDIPADSEIPESTSIPSASLLAKSFPNTSIKAPG